MATQRLADLVGGREASSPTEAQPLVIDAPEHALRPIARIAAAVCLLVAAAVWLNRPQAVTAVDVQAGGVTVAAPTSVASSSSIGSPVSTSAAPAASIIIVDVEGHVRHPGLVTLPGNSRVADAISAAGGLTKHIAAGALNLAQKVSDGQLILVSSGIAQSSSQSSIAGSAGASGGLININSASATDLDALPGVGPIMSSRIIAWRAENGGFHSVDDLQQVPGIGPKVFANLKPLVCI